MVRSDVAKEFGDDYIGFLRCCEIQLEIRVLTPADLGRVSELAQRTNQLNFSGAKYKGEDVASFMADPTLENYVLECSDKYGSYGIVGFCVAKRSPGVVLVLELMLLLPGSGQIHRTGALSLPREPGYFDQSAGDHV